MARPYARAGGLDLLVVDYLQLVEVEQSRTITQEQAVASVSRCLKNLSVQLDCHVIVLSQLNDDSRKRESRAIRNDASVVIKVERPDADEPESPRAGGVDLVIDKNRFGPTACVNARGIKAVRPPPGSSTRSPVSSPRPSRSGAACRPACATSPAPTGPAPPPARRA